MPQTIAVLADSHRSILEPIPTLLGACAEEGTRPFRLRPAGYWANPGRAPFPAEAGNGRGLPGRARPALPGPFRVLCTRNDTPGVGPVSVHRAACDLSGIFVDADGSPLPEATVTIDVSCKGVKDERMTLRTDKGGAFSAKGRLRAASGVVLSLDVEGKGKWKSEKLDASAGVPVDRGQVKIQYKEAAGERSGRRISGGPWWKIPIASVIRSARLRCERLATPRIARTRHLRCIRLSGWNSMPGTATRTSTLSVSREGQGHSAREEQAAATYRWVQRQWVLGR
jgi:hypothetical protein